MQDAYSTRADFAERTMCSDDSSDNVSGDEKDEVENEITETSSFEIDCDRVSSRVQPDLDKSLVVCNRAFVSHARSIPIAS